MLLPQWKEPVLPLFVLSFQYSWSRNMFFNFSLKLVVRPLPVSSSIKIFNPFSLWYLYLCHESTLFQKLSSENYHFLNYQILLKIILKIIILLKKFLPTTFILHYLTIFHILLSCLNSFWDKLGYKWINSKCLIIKMFRWYLKFFDILGIWNWKIRSKASCLISFLLW